MTAGESSWFFHQNSPAILPAVIWEQTGGMDKSREDLALQAFLFIHANDFVHTVKVYDKGTPALLSFRRKECCEFLSPLNIHRQGCLNPRPLGPVVRTLTATPPLHQLNTHLQLHEQARSRTWFVTGIQGSIDLCRGDSSSKISGTEIFRDSFQSYVLSLWYVLCFHSSYARRENKLSATDNARAAVQFLYDKVSFSFVTVLRAHRSFILSTDHKLALRGVNVLSTLRGEDRACRWTEDFLLVSDKKT
jgi:hypothetical protein